MISSLNKYEMQLVTDADVMLTKNKLIQTVYSLFGKLAEEYKNRLQELSIEKETMNAKIARGENYQGLPYVIMDYPRLFGKVDTFAIRSFFWWGNFFSITLHLSGSYQQKYAPAIKSAIEKDHFKGWYISSPNNQWAHHFSEENYAAIEEGVNYDMERLPFLKLAKKIPLTQWDEASLFFTENFSRIIQSLKV